MPLKYWNEAFRATVVLYNRLPTPLLNNKSPIEILTHVTPNYSMLKVFGCSCYVTPHFLRN